MPNTTYVAAYLAPKGHYSATYGYFYSPPPTGGNALNSPPLHALPAGSTSANGLYAYSATSTFPTSTYEGTNYYVDVAFTPAPAPGQVTGVKATAGSGSATVSWSAPTSGGPVTSYIVTPYIGSTAQTPVTVSGSPPVTTTTVTGLTAGTAYTFKVQASNPTGSGTVSAASNSVTPTAPTAPEAPTGVSASPASGRVLVSWTAPGNEGGSPVTGYLVTPYVGSTAGTPVSAGASASSLTLTGLSNGTSYTLKVAAINAIGTGPVAASNAVTPQDTIFDFATPTIVDAGDPGSVELGVKFTPSVKGTVTGIRFYKAAANTGTHIGSLWSAGGTLLASATFTNETASGWQQVYFSTPVQVAPNTTYVAGYFAPNGHYSMASGAFSSGGVENGPLLALANGTSGNGVFAYGTASTFPSGSFNASNYYTDVLFEPAPPPTGPPSAPTGVSASPATSQALVSWTAPSNEGGSAITGYTVTPYAGGAPQTPVSVGASAVSTRITGLSNGTSYTFTVAAKNSIGTGQVSSASNAVTPQDTIFDFATPAVVDAEDSSSVELGVKFTSDVSGSITGIRFYKAAGNTGTHIGSLWSASGTLLAQATFTNETASGWQQVNFSSPVAIISGTTYIAAYLAPNGNYSVTSAAFSSAGVDNPPLHALANSVSADGVYAYSSTSTFPTNTFSSTNYYVNVTFTPGSEPPGAPTGVSASAATSQALVSWVAPASNGGSPVTGYTVTPYIGGVGQTPVQVGASASSATITGLTNGTSYTFKVAASSAIGTGQAGVSNAVTPQDTIFDFATPSVIDAGDASSVELGVKFTSDVSGSVTGVRFYKAAANTGTHIGSLWTASGTLLASATFTNETTSGWQQATFAEPVPITAGTTYVAGYFAPNGHYPVTSAAFGSGGVENGPLLALANGTSPNGLYAYSSTSVFPSGSYNASNYYVDVSFAPEP